MVNEIILSHPRLKLMPTICLADCKALDHKRLQMIPLFRNQLESADILVLSKCDLLENQEKAGKILNELKSNYRSISGFD